MRAVEHTLDARAADYIDGTSKLIKSVAMLVQTPAMVDDSSMSTCENYTNHAIRQTGQHPNLQVLVQLRLNLISNVRVPLGYYFSGEISVILCVFGGQEKIPSSAPPSCSNIAPTAPL